VFRIRFIALVAAAALLPAGAAQAQPGLIGKVDLMTTKGVEEVKGEWRYAVVTTGVGEKKNEIEPKAHGAFDDSKWEILKPETLKDARGVGGYCWCWYRIKVTIPDMVGGKKFEGGPVWFRTVVDDYGEVWVDGALNHKVGETGRGEVSGFNTMNRVRLQKPDTTGKKGAKRDAKPGDVFQIAVLGINGPLGNPPGNQIFLRAPTGLEFFAADAPDGGANKPALVADPKGTQVAKLNLLTKTGVEAVKGEWRRHRVEVHTGPKKNEIAPKAHGKFDDSKWQVVSPDVLKKWDKEWEPGKFSIAWYRIQITVPDKIDGKDVAGKALWFKTTVDDYGEVWVNGKIDLAFGKGGAGAISGFNYPNLVKLTDSAKPGETIQIAVLAINSPWGNPPNNGIFFRNADLLVYDAATKK
jgi:hypothetical protein